ncbi:MAG: FAD-dependent oxidoreductase [Planctomycetota bacterium]
MSFVVVGAGVIGLSIAFELALRGHRVSILESGVVGKKASWAGAGILIPANAETAIHPMEHLEALSHDVHRDWSKRLKELTGIDNRFSLCGGIYLARTLGEQATLAGSCLEWRAREIPFEEFTDSDFLARMKPGQEFRKILWLPGESQIESPSHLQALAAANQKLGVNISAGLDGLRFVRKAGRVHCMNSASDDTDVTYIFAAGAWTSQILKDLEVYLPLQPVRGQMVLYRIPLETLSPLPGGPVINEGTRYLVPRLDGHVLAGSTIEEVGFVETTTDSGIADIRQWAESLFSELNDSTYVKSWAGLRPGSYDGFPYLGRITELENAFVATGHFKGGLQLSTATAIVMSDLVEGKQPRIDLDPFSPNRVSKMDA